MSLACAAEAAQLSLSVTGVAVGAFAGAGVQPARSPQNVGIGGMMPRPRRSPTGLSASWAQTFPVLLPLRIASRAQLAPTRSPARLPVLHDVNTKCLFVLSACSRPYTQLKLETPSEPRSRCKREG